MTNGSEMTVVCSEDREQPAHRPFTLTYMEKYAGKVAWNWNIKILRNQGGS